MGEREGREDKLDRILPAHIKLLHPKILRDKGNCSVVGASLSKTAMSFSVRHMSPMLEFSCLLAVVMMWGWRSFAWARVVSWATTMA
ncbi:MAG: hypothetical protein IJX45_01055 [Spirochaetaceae bacterium]|nr:hypothetical protein [Spirochaetaceae bacterium]